MEFRNIKTFCTVANHSSFQRASETLHYAQSTVSAQIQALEEELGVRLFDRLGRRIMLTEAGESLLNYARKMLDLPFSLPNPFRPPILSLKPSGLKSWFSWPLVTTP
jgi:DNA-binding transcriptional LysR family regulator